MKITVFLDDIDPETDAQADEAAARLEEVAAAIRRMGFGPLYSMHDVLVA